VRGAPGQLAPYQSMWKKWQGSPPPWMANWAFTVFNQLKVSQAIRTHKFGLTQFFIGQPGWERYLKGEERDPKRALRRARDLVQAEVKKSKKK
jgi:multiple sugar transport system substrate-binding protein